MRYTMCMRIPARRYPTSFHLSLHARTLLKALAQHFGLSQAAVLELLLRKYAREEHIEACPIMETTHEETTS